MQFKSKTAKLVFYGDLLTLIGSFVAALYFLENGNTTVANACFLSAAVSLVLIVFQPVQRLQSYLLAKKIGGKVNQHTTIHTRT